MAALSMWIVTLFVIFAAAASGCGKSDQVDPPVPETPATTMTPAERAAAHARGRAFQLGYTVAIAVMRDDDVYFDQARVLARAFDVTLVKPSGNPVDYLLSDAMVGVTNTLATIEEHAGDAFMLAIDLTLLGVVSGDGKEHASLDTAITAHAAAVGLGVAPLVAPHLVAVAQGREGKHEITQLISQLDEHLRVAARIGSDGGEATAGALDRPEVRAATYQNAGFLLGYHLALATLSARPDLFEEAKTTAKLIGIELTPPSGTPSVYLLGDAAAPIQAKLQALDEKAYAAYMLAVGLVLMGDARDRGAALVQVERLCDVIDGTAKGLGDEIDLMVTKVTASVRADKAGRVEIMALLRRIGLLYEARARG